MKAFAYYKASEGDSSNEIQLGRLIDRFGVQAVMNRPYLGIGEINRIVTAERIMRLSQSVTEYRDNEGNINWVKWAQDDPKGAADLAEAQKAAADRGLLDG